MNPGAALLVLAVLLANVKLYLKDGGYQIVREYKVENDRVRYYSVERSEWEEIPLELVDLKRTEADAKQVEETRKAEAAAVDSEERVERERRQEVARVPAAAGVYLIAGPELKPVKQGESKIVTSKRRAVLKAISPVPIVSGKATVELDGVASATVITDSQPEFYIRLSAEERFGIIRLTPAKNSRVVQKWDIIPLSKEIVEDMRPVEIFRHQVEEDLYKIWPEKPLAAGEYAVFQYTEGKGNIQVWDFSCQPAAK